MSNMLGMLMSALLFSQRANPPINIEQYTVRQGDTLWKISQSYGTTLNELIEANPQLADPNLIYPGQQINIPMRNTGEYNTPDNNNIDIIENNMEEQVLQLINNERTQRGIEPLSINQRINETARLKSEDMAINNYFSHTSPTYGSPFDMLNYFGINFRSAAENIAQGQRTAQAVVNAWMNSQNHRDNILNPNFTQTGVGFADNNSTTYWTQMFIRP